MTLKIASFDLRQLRRGAAAKMVRQPAVLSISGLIECVFDARGMDYLYEALDGTAIRYAAEKRNPAESIAELRETPTATTTSWLRRAGITAGSWYASPATRVGHELIAAGMPILAGGGAGRPQASDLMEGSDVLESRF